MNTRMKQQTTQRNVQQMLAYTPNARITAKDALEHPYFHGLNRDTVGKIACPF